MKLCIVTSSFPRYPGDYSGFFAYEQALALSKRHEVHVVYPTNLPSKGHIADSLHRHPFVYPFKKYPLAQVKGPGLAVGVPRLLWSLAAETAAVRRDFGIDLIYAFWTIPAGFACSLIKHRTPVLLGLMGSDLQVFGRQRLTRPFISRAIKKATRIVAVSNDLKREAVELGGAADRIEVIPTGVDTNKFRPMEKAELKHRLGIPEGFTWLYSGSLFKLKRVDRIITAAARLRGMASFHLVIVGDGPERSSLESMVRELGLDNVIFKGAVPRDEMPLYSAAADVLVLLSETEGLPNCVQEAMACAVPVVATCVGGLPDVVNDGITGHLVKNDSDVELYLSKLTNSPRASADMGARALEFARSSLSTDLVMARIADACELTAAMRTN